MLNKNLALLISMLASSTAFASDNSDDFDDELEVEESVVSSTDAENSSYFDGISLFGGIGLSDIGADLTKTLIGDKGISTVGSAAFSSSIRVSIMGDLNYTVLPSLFDSCLSLSAGAIFMKNFQGEVEFTPKNKDKDSLDAVKTFLKDQNTVKITSNSDKAEDDDETEEKSVTFQVDGDIRAGLVAKLFRDIKGIYGSAAVAITTTTAQFGNIFILPMLSAGGYVFEDKVFLGFSANKSFHAFKKDKDADKNKALHLLLTPGGVNFHFTPAVNISAFI